MINRTALITGATRGIGKAIAQTFAIEGYDLALTARSQADLEFLKKEIAGCDGQCALYAADLSQPESVTNIVSYFTNTFGNIDILVNNALHLNGSSFMFLCQ